MVFVFTQYGTTYSWIASSMARPPAKRAAAFAFINAFANTAPIWTSYTYNDTQKPYYRQAIGICLALQLMGGVFAVAMRMYLSALNKRMERMESVDAVLTEKDLTRLQRTAEIEGIDIAAARRLQKGFRFQL
jgi:hypothetical protein